MAHVLHGVCNGWPELAIWMNNPVRTWKAQVRWTQLILLKNKGCPGFNTGVVGRNNRIELSGYLVHYKGGLQIL